MHERPRVMFSERSPKQYGFKTSTKSAVWPRDSRNYTKHVFLGIRSESAVVPRRTCERARIGGEALVVGSDERPVARLRHGGATRGDACRLCLSLSVAQFEFGARSVRRVASYRRFACARDPSTRRLASPVLARVFAYACRRASRDIGPPAHLSVRPSVRRRAESRSPGRISRNGSRRTSSRAGDYAHAHTRTRTYTQRRFRSVFEMRRKPAVPTAAAGSSIAPHVRVS